MWFINLLFMGSVIQAFTIGKFECISVENTCIMLFAAFSLLFVLYISKLNIISSVYSIL